MVKLDSLMSQGILAVYFGGEEAQRPRFYVVTTEHWWVSCLSPYYDECLTSAYGKKDAWALSFSFHALYAAMLCYPPFANAVLRTQKFNLENLQSVYNVFPILARQLNPINIKMSYSYVTPQQTQEEVQ